MASELDDFFGGIENYSAKTKNLSRDLELLRSSMLEVGQATYTIASRKIEFKTNITALTQDLRETQVGFERVGSAAVQQQKALKKVDYTQTIKEFSVLQTSLTKNAEAMDIFSQKAEKAGKAGGGKLTSQVPSDIKGQAVEAASSFGSSILNSAFGSETGGTISTLAGGLVQGLQTGNVAGVVVSMIGSVFKIIEDKIKKEDEGHGQVVKSEYQRVTEKRETGLQQGIASAGAQQEVAGLLSTQMGGSAATRIIQQSRDYAAKMPYDATGISKAALQLSRYGVEQDAVMTRIQQLGDMAQGQDAVFQELVSAYGSMTKSQNVTLPELNTMMEAGIPILQTLATQCGVTEQDIASMAQNGELSIQSLNQALGTLTAPGGRYAGTDNQMKQQYDSLVTLTSNLEGELHTAEGEGYMEKVIPEMQKYVEFLQGEGGERIKEAYRLSGASQGEVEGERINQKITALDYLVNKNDNFKTAMESGDGPAVDRMLSQADIVGEANFRNSDVWNEQLNNEKLFIQYIQDNTVEVWENYGHKAAEQFNAGWIGSRIHGFFHGVDFGGDSTSGTPNTPGSKPGTETGRPTIYTNNSAIPFSSLGDENGNITGRAYGLPYVPYDNYAALLHQGERVLTAREARNYQDGGGVSINIGGMTVREEADIDRIAKTIVREIQYAKVGYGG